MNISKTKNNPSRKILLVVAGLVTVAVAATGVYWWQTQSNSTQVPTGEQAGEQSNNFVKDEDKSISPEPQTPSSNEDNGSEDKVITPSGGDNSSVSSIEQPTITRATMSGDNIRVSAIINSSSNGKCRLVMEKDGYSSFEQTADIIVGSSYYTCNGFRVPKSSLPATGLWKAKVVHERDEQSAASETQTINVE